VFYDIIYFYFWDKNRPPFDTSIVNVCIGTLIIYICGIYEILDAVFFYNSYMLFIYSTCAVQIGMTFTLYNRFRGMYKQLEQTNVTLEATVRERTRELEEQAMITVEASRAKSEFLETMNHEMKTPLTIIATDIQLAESHIDTGDYDAARKLMREAWQETMLVADTVTGAVTFARSRDSSNTIEYIDFAALIETTLNVFEPLMKKHGNSLVREISPALSAIKGNTDMLTGMLINLLSNSNRHTKDGVITVRWFDYPQGEGKYCFELSDNGEGIAPELLPKVFERGVSGADSSGLGLAIVKKIIESHNGEVSLESESGKGTKVRLLFPM
jgi:signal transduction histidine kinase